MVDAVRKTFRSDGLRGFWQGYSLNLVRTIPQANAPPTLAAGVTPHLRPPASAPLNQWVGLPYLHPDLHRPLRPPRPQCVITFVAYEWMSDLLQTKLQTTGARGGLAATASDVRPLEALVRRHSSGKPQGG